MTARRHQLVRLATPSPLETVRFGIAQEAIPGRVGPDWGCYSGTIQQERLTYDPDRHTEPYEFQGDYYWETSGGGTATTFEAYNISIWPIASGDRVAAYYDERQRLWFCEPYLGQDSHWFRPRRYVLAEAQRLYFSSTNWHPLTFNAPSGNLAAILDAGDPSHLDFADAAPHGLTWEVIVQASGYSHDPEVELQVKLSGDAVAEDLLIRSNAGGDFQGLHYATLNAGDAATTLEVYAKGDDNGSAPSFGLDLVLTLTPLCPATDA